MIEPITAEEIVSSYAKWLNKAGTYRTKSEAIIAQTALITGIPVADLLSQKRTRQIAHARQAAMLRIAEETTLSLPQIGRLFHRDHTTVLHGIRAARLRRERKKFPLGFFKSRRAQA